MRLIDPETFQKRYFDPDCAPCLRTVRSDIEKGILPGRIIGDGKKRKFWIDAEAWEQEPNTGNELADRILF